MLINEVCNLIGLTQKAIAYYVAQGLIDIEKIINLIYNVPYTRGDNCVYIWNGLFKKGLKLLAKTAGITVLLGAK